LSISSGIPIVLGERRVLQPGRLRRLRAVAWMVGMAVLIGLSLRVAMVPAQQLLPKGDPVLGLAASGIACLFALGIYSLLVRLGEDRWPGELALKPAAGQLAIGLGLGSAMFVAVMTILIGAGLYSVEWHGAAPAWRGAGLAMQSAVVEELLVRGVILRLLWRAFGPAVAFAASAALFGLGHAFNPGATVMSVVCIALEAGVMLGALYALTGRLWMSIGVHAAWNFTQGYVFGAAVSGSDFGPSLARSVAHGDASVWLSGGSFGPEASLPALLVCGAVGVATLWLAARAGGFRGEAAAG